VNNFVDSICNPKDTITRPLFLW